jgi:hypothetical protein
VLAFCLEITVACFSFPVIFWYMHNLVNLPLNTETIRNGRQVDELLKWEGTYSFFGVPTI